MNAKLFSGGNTHYIGLQELTNDLTELPVTGATVTCSIKQNGSNIDGVAWPVTLEEDSNGDYWGVIPADADIKPGQKYQVNISVEAGDDRAEFSQTIYAESRSFSDTQLSC